VDSTKNWVTSAFLVWGSGLVASNGLNGVKFIILPDDGSGINFPKSKKKAMEMTITICWNMTPCDLVESSDKTIVLSFVYSPICSYLSGGLILQYHSPENKHSKRHKLQAIFLGYLVTFSLSRIYCDMTPESRNSSLLGNGSVN
jgi:hypothetical protein